MPIFKQEGCFAPDNKRACRAPQTLLGWRSSGGVVTLLVLLTGPQLKAFGAFFYDKRARNYWPAANHKI
jgi:hypothetical protein